MMSSTATSSPVSASTLAYLMRWPVLRLIWLKLTFSVSDVAGYRATGRVTSERRKKPFQLARGAMGKTPKTQLTKGRGYHRGRRFQTWRGRESRNGVNRAPGKVRSVATLCTDRPHAAVPKDRNMIFHHALLSTGGVEA